MKITVIGAFVAAGLAVLAAGCGRHCDPADRAEHITKRLAKKLDLSEEQKAKTLPLVQALVAEHEGWHGQGPQVLAELGAQFGGAAFDAKALDQALAKREQKLASSRAVLVQKLAEFHAILSPEQRSKAAAALKRLETRWERHGRRHRHGH